MTTLDMITKNIDMVLCNNITTIDEDIFFECEVFQYYLIASQSDKEYLESYGIEVQYSEILDLWVVGIDHLGTGWDNIEVTQS